MLVWRARNPLVVAGAWWEPQVTWLPSKPARKRYCTTAVDVYGLGAVLYELLTGQQPFHADTPLDTVLQVVEREPSAPSRLNPAIDADLETICLKCLRKEPLERYGSAEALADDLDRWRAGKPIAARPISGLQRAWRWCRHNPAIAGLTASLLMALLAGSVISTVLSLRATTSAGMARRNELEAVRNLYLGE